VTEGFASRFFLVSSTVDGTSLFLVEEHLTGLEVPEIPGVEPDLELLGLGVCKTATNAGGDCSNVRLERDVLRLQTRGEDGLDSGRTSFPFPFLKDREGVDFDLDKFDGLSSISAINDFNFPPSKNKGLPNLIRQISSRFHYIL